MFNLTSSTNSHQSRPKWPHQQALSSPKHEEVAVTNAVAPSTMAAEAGSQSSPMHDVVGSEPRQPSCCLSDSVCGSSVVRTLKTLNDISDFILVRASEPYVQQYGVLHVRNAQSRVLTMVRIKLHGAILGFLADRFRLGPSANPFYRSPCLPLYTGEGMGVQIRVVSLGFLALCTVLSSA